MLPLAGRRRRARRRGGRGRPLALGRVRTCRPARRSPCSRAPCSRVAAAGARSRATRRRARAAAGSRLLALARRGLRLERRQRRQRSTWSRRRRRSATGRAQVGGDAVDVHQILQPNTDPHEYEPRPADVAGDGGAKRRVRERRRPRRLDGQGRRRGRRQPDGRRARRPRAGQASRARRRDRRRRATTRTGGTTRATRSRPCEQIRDALVGGRPGAHATSTRRNADAYLTRCARSTRQIAACVAHGPGGRAQARHRPRRLRLLRAPLRHHGRRRGDPVADDAGAAVGAATPRGSIALIRREHVKAVFPESSINPRLAQTIARETGATADYTLYGDTLGPKGSAGATYLTMEARERGRDGRGLHAAGGSTAASGAG